MKKPRSLLLLDALINLLLGLLLILFPDSLIHSLGMPPSADRFYPNILGAIFAGITIALIIEFFRRPESTPGLGFAGAIAINICGLVMLTLWLLFGGLDIPTRGYVILWALDAVLVLIIAAELRVRRRQ